MGTKPSLEELQALGLKGTTAFKTSPPRPRRGVQEQLQHRQKGLEDGSWNYGPDDNWTKIVKVHRRRGLCPCPPGTHDPGRAGRVEDNLPQRQVPDKFNNPQDAKAWVYKNLNNPNAST